MVEGEVILKPGREKPLRRRHPWVFSGAIAHVESAPPGGLVTVRSHEGAFLARGYYNPHSQIRVRVLTWDPDEQVDEVFWQRRIEAAWSRRDAVVRGDGSAWRAVHAENDGIPGLIVDVYGPWLVVQVLTLGIERVLSQIVDVLVEVARPRGILERSDVNVRQREGLSPRVRVLWGEEPPEQVEITEGGCRFLVDLWRGQKTGFYLDQRLNRAQVAAFAAGREVLNGFGYTGGFAVYALVAGAAHVVNVDTSGEALELAEENLRLNGWTEERWENVEEDMFRVLRAYRREGRMFDLVILDPPKFATHQAALSRATRGYKDINMLALQVLRPGGILATFSCSGLVSPDLFQKIVFGASVDARVDAQILHFLGQPPDHPVLLSFPQGRYLKGLIARRVG